MFCCFLEGLDLQECMDLLRVSSSTFRSLAAKIFTTSNTSNSNSREQIIRSLKMIKTQFKVENEIPHAVCIR